MGLLSPAIDHLIAAPVERVFAAYDPTHLEEYRWRQDNDILPERMIRSGEGVCFLVYLKGGFDGAAEEVEIVESEGWWYLRGNADNRGSRSVEARARCWRFPWSERIESTEEER